MGATLFEKFNEMFGGATGLQDLQQEVKAQAESAANSNREFVKVPYGDYEVKVVKIELAETGEKSNNPGMPKANVWFEVLTDGYKGQKIFMNQMLTSAFGIHKMNEFLSSLESGVPIVFEEFEQYNDLFKAVFAEIDGRAEYQLAYGQNNKGFDTYTIVQRFQN